jgi:hypothetical protein
VVIDIGTESQHYDEHGGEYLVSFVEHLFAFIGCPMMARETCFSLSHTRLSNHCLPTFYCTMRKMRTVDLNAMGLW